MPKRSINLFEENYDSDKEKVEEDFTLEDFLENDNTREIIENQHYFDFVEKMGDRIKYVYRRFAYLNSDNHFLNDREMLCDNLFLDFIYDKIIKDYDNDFIKENSLLENKLLDDYVPEERKQRKNKEKKVQVIKDKKFDWATKTYK